MTKARNIDSMKQLHEESTELGRSLKLLRNACMVLIIILGAFLIFYLLFSEACEAFYMEKKNSADAFSPVHFVASLLSGRASLILSNGSFDKAAFIFGYALTLVSLSVFIYVCHFLSKIFISISKGHTPFNIENADALKTTASALSILGGAYMLLGRDIIVLIIIGLTASFFYALSKIFQYGSILQQESDETL